MLNRVDTMPKLAPPEDASITTLYVGGLTPVITEDDIRDQFYSYGELQSVKKVSSSLSSIFFSASLLNAACASPFVSVVSGFECLNLLQSGRLNSMLGCRLSRSTARL